MTLDFGDDAKHDDLYFRKIGNKDVGCNLKHCSLHFRRTVFENGFSAGKFTMCPVTES